MSNNLKIEELIKLMSQNKNISVAIFDEKKLKIEMELIYRKFVYDFDKNMKKGSLEEAVKIMANVNKILYCLIETLTDIEIDFEKIIKEESVLI